MKVKPSVKRICEKCKIIKRHGKIMVICENPKLGDDEYTVATIERALQAAWGRYYEPRNERYDFRLRVGNKEVKL